ncbi:endomucin isoform X1 [Alligator sinensis]|uniref:Endomucin isoform X1 n=1 Tax=Alligator sinensis TaxID=38654 RepID=A0A1U7RPL7_ALLSI|nr:endomucin isoform X1 [Alligator sinensis]
MPMKPSTSMKLLEVALLFLAAFSTYVTNGISSTTTSTNTQPTKATIAEHAKSNENITPAGSALAVNTTEANSTKIPDKSFSTLAGTNGTNDTRVSPPAPAETNGTNDTLVSPPTPAGTNGTNDTRVSPPAPAGTNGTNDTLVSPPTPAGTNGTNDTLVSPPTPVEDNTRARSPGLSTSPVGTNTADNTSGSATIPERTGTNATNGTTQSSGHSGGKDKIVDSSPFSNVILPVVIALIVITLSVFILVALCKMCRKTTPERQENGTEQAPSDKEGVKLLSVKTASETGEQSSREE